MSRDIIAPFGAFVLLLVSLFIMSGAAKEAGRAAQAVTDLRREIQQMHQQDRDYSNRIQEWEDMTYSHVVKLDTRLGERQVLKSPPKLKGE